MDVLRALLVASFAVRRSWATRGPRRQMVSPVSHRFSQVALKGGGNDDEGLMSFLFHGPVAPRHVNFGLEDSNKAVATEIEINEEERHLEDMLNRVQESEQNQVDALQESLFLQNAQLDQVRQFLTQ